MGQAPGESPGDAAQRRLPDFEDRVIDEDEEVESDRNVSTPSFVLKQV